MTNNEQGAAILQLIEDHKNAKRIRTLVRRQLAAIAPRLASLAQQLCDHDFDAAAGNADLLSADLSRLPDLLRQESKASREIREAERDLAQLGLDLRP